ncbi:MAG TPA: hypothetical protein VFV49_07255, partial [Thermoanaerobaculia bacterium]|nr:hypothetical protein [Thermoanaerobaculia bacterium]
VASSHVDRSCATQSPLPTSSGERARVRGGSRETITAPTNTPTFHTVNMCRGFARIVFHGTHGARHRVPHLGEALYFKKFIVDAVREAGYFKNFIVDVCPRGRLFRKFHR